MMVLRRSLYLSVGVLSGLMLSSCGEGWVAVKTTDAFPYGNQRTAGSGVAYVRAKLLPEHDLKLEIEATLPPPIMKAEDVFKKALRK